MSSSITEEQVLEPYGDDGIKIRQKVVYSSISDFITLEHYGAEIAMTVDEFYALVELADKALQRKVYNRKITIGDGSKN